MTQRTFSPATLVTTWLLLLAQHKPLVEFLSGRKGLRLDQHLQNLATHAMTLLTTGKVDLEAAERAKQFHAAVGAFRDEKKAMSIYVFDSLALPALAGGLPEVSTFNAIKTLAKAHGAPLEATTLAWQADRAIQTLMHLYDASNGAGATTGATGVKDVMGALLSPEGREGREALQIDGDTLLINDCSELLRLVRNLADEMQVEHIIDVMTASLPR